MLVVFELFITVVEYIVGEELNEMKRPRLQRSESGRGETIFHSQNRGNYRGRSLNYPFSSGVNSRFSRARGGGRSVSVDGRANAASSVIYVNFQRPGHLARERTLLRCFK